MNIAILDRNYIQLHDNNDKCHLAWLKNEFIKVMIFKQNLEFSLQLTIESKDSNIELKTYVNVIRTQDSIEK